MNFNQFKKIFIIFVPILFVITILYVLNSYQKQKVYQLEKNLFDSFNFVQKLAYIGMQQFKKGLSEHNKRYEEIFIGDPIIFEELVKTGTLRTASTPLILGTIDFISECLKKKINLYINEKHYLSTSDNLLKKSETEILDLKIRNYNNIHFFVNEYEDTIGDGYCFFHALDNVLEKKIPNWRKNILFNKIL